MFEKHNRFEDTMTKQRFGVDSQLTLNEVFLIDGLLLTFSM